MLQPKKVKHRRVMKGRMRGKATRGEKLSFGDFGLKTLEAAWITDRQIEAARIAMTRHVKRGGKIWIRIQGVEEGLALEAFALAAQKLPIKVKFVTRADLEGGVV